MATDDREPLATYPPNKEVLSLQMSKLGFGCYFDFPEQIPTMKSTEVPPRVGRIPLGTTSTGTGPSATGR